MRNLLLLHSGTVGLLQLRPVTVIVVVIVFVVDGVPDDVRCQHLANQRHERRDVVSAGNRAGGESRERLRS